MSRTDYYTTADFVLTDYIVGYYTAGNCTADSASSDYTGYTADSASPDCTAVDMNYNRHLSYSYNAHLMVLHNNCFRNRAQGKTVLEVTT